MLGFWTDEANVFGPAHEYVPPPLDVRLKVLPTQTGPLFEAVAVGEALTLSVTWADVAEPHDPVTTTR